MEQILKGKKLNMSQIFLDNGKVVPVTLIALEQNSQDQLATDLESKDIVIVGTSKGKGFTGGMKRWHFRGAETTRGQSTKPRAPGSIGSQTPGRVRKGKKMAGRKGNYRITLKGIRIVKVLPQEKTLMVSGPVPGARNSLVEIRII